MAIRQNYAASHKALVFKVVQHDLKPRTYAIVPWSFADDEPISELIQAIALMVSNLATTRKLNKYIPVYIENSAEGIRTSTTKALQEGVERISRNRLFAGQYRKSLNNELSHLKRLIGLTN